MTEKRLALGRWGEDRAVEYLLRRRMKIVERNYRTPLGEIDIIASDGRTLVFVEVKTRSSLLYGTPQEAVGPTKQRQILRSAQWYLSSCNKTNSPVRFDVIAVIRHGEEPQIDHIIDAFGA